MWVLQHRSSKDWRRILMCYFFTRGALLEGGLYKAKWFKTTGDKKNIKRMIRPVYEEMWQKKNDGDTDWDAIRTWFQDIRSTDPKTAKEALGRMNFQMGAGVNELLSLGRYTLAKRLKVMREFLAPSDSNCVLTCQCGITHMSADVVFGFTGGASKVGFCTPDSNLLQFQRVKHREWRSYLTEQTIYMAKPEGGQDIVHKAPECKFHEEKDEMSYRYIATFALGIYLQFDFWLEYPAKDDMTWGRGINIRLLMEGDGPNKKQFAALGSGDEGGEFYDLVQGLSDDADKRIEWMSAVGNPIRSGEKVLSEWAEDIFSGQTGSPFQKFMSKLSNFGLKKINMANNVIKAISDKLPFKVTDAQYVGIDVGLEWFSKTKGQGANFKRLPEAAEVSLYSMTQRGGEFTAGSPEIAASLGFWVGSTTKMNVRFIGAVRRARTFAFNVDEIVQFRIVQFRDQYSDWLDGKIKAQLDNPVGLFYKIEYQPLSGPMVASSVPVQTVTFEQVSQNDVRPIGTQK